MKPRTIVVCILALLFAALSIPCHANEKLTLFGPQIYEREKGKPFTEISTFNIADLTGTGQLIIHNGGGDKKTRTSSAEIWFNDNLIFSQNDFNKNVQLLEAEVPLVEANEISVKLNGKPGSYLTAEVITWVDSPNPGEPSLLDGAVLYSDDTLIDITTMDFETDEGVVNIEAAVGRVIVLFNLDVPAITAESLIRSNGGTVIEKIPNVGFYVAEVSPGSEISFADIMQQYASVYFAAVDFVLSDTQYTSDPVEGIGGREYLTQIRAPEAWEFINDQAKKRWIDIGILDTGYRGFGGTHNDFRGRWKKFGNIYTIFEHGTQVAAIAGAAGNTDDRCNNAAANNICGNIGIDWTNGIVLADRGILPSTLFQKMLYMVYGGVDVINISAGGGFLGQNDNGTCDIGETYAAKYFIYLLSNYVRNINLYLSRFNVEFIVLNAAGNEGCNLGDIEKPENLMIVGGVNGMARHPLSMYGKVVDIAAPFVIQGYYSYARAITEQIGGTSISTPLVSGSAALIWSYDDDNLTAEEVVERLKKSAQGEISDFGGAGLLDVYAAQDQCPSTPIDEQPNQFGCSISQMIVDLEFPSNNAINIPPESINFKWKRLDLPNESTFDYFVSVKEDSEPNDIIIFEGYVGNQIEIQLFNFELGKKYLWAVWAIDQQGHWSKAREAGDWWNFTIELDPNDVDNDGDDLTENQGDCNDFDSAIYLGAPELCDGKDNQCPGDTGYGTTDEGCTTGGLVAHWSFNNQSDPAHDDSNNGHDGQVFGATWIPTGAIGGAMSFDGVDDFIRVLSNELLESGNVKTVSAWVNKYGTTNLGNNYAIATKYQADSPNESGWLLGAGTVDGETHARSIYRGMPRELRSESSINEWHLVTMTLLETGSSFEQRLYVDGIEVDFTEGELGSIYLQGNSHDVLIGACHYYDGTISPYSYFYGLIDEVRIYIRTLTVAEIQELFQQGINLQQGLVAHYPLDNNVNDIAGGNHGNPYGGFSYVPGVLGQAASFDGVDDSIELPNNHFDTQSFSLWFKMDQIPESRRYGLFERMSPVSYDNFQGYRLRVTAIGSLNWQVNSYSPDNSISLYSSTSVDDNQWHHTVAIIERISLNSLTSYYYLDGVEIGRDTINVGSYNHNDYLYIGDDTAYTEEDHLKGLIDDFRIYNRALSSAEIQALANP